MEQPGAGEPASAAPAVSTGLFMVQGHVMAQTGGVANAAVNLWIQMQGFGYSYWWAHGPLHTDANGHFIASDVPSSTATVFVSVDGYRQPCDVSLDPATTQVADVELISVSSLDEYAPAPPQSGGPPELTGTVYEVTASGRVPIAGAELWAESVPDAGIATTRTDLSGHFYLCRLPAGVWVYVNKDGFRGQSLGPLDGMRSQVLSVELTRQ
jgi:hypothetical protein